MRTGDHRVEFELRYPPVATCIFEMIYIFEMIILIGLLVVGFKADCLTRYVGLCVGCPPWGSFQGILAHMYASFGKEQGKLRTARLIRSIGD